MSCSTNPLQVVWFKRDIRVHDHRPLARAAAAGPVLPLYIVEPEYWRLPDSSHRHYMFLREGLQALRADLTKLGQPLIIRVGNAVDVLQELFDELPIAALWSHQETGNAWTYDRDKQVAAWCQQMHLPWKEERQDGVIRRLGSRDGWAGKWDAFMQEPITPAPRVLPAIETLDIGALPSAEDIGFQYDGHVRRQPGGRTEAVGTLDSFLFERGKSYQRAMSSPVSARDTCSRLSPYIAWGMISVREVAQAAWSRNSDLQLNPGKDSSIWRRSLSSFAGRLHWRCHFMQKLEDEPRLEYENLHPAYDGLRSYGENSPLFAAWATGQTGYPFLDACMRSLIATGWLNFRMRAMLMAVASYHLWLDWRRTGEHLARLFTDYEPGIHWSQVQMQSGTTGINAVRVYNPVRQGYEQDPGGRFVRQWLPELAPVPDAFIHEPWKWPRLQDTVDDAYPVPVFDHEITARVAKEKIWAVRKTAGHKDIARQIAEKHGSRKSGMTHRMRASGTQRSRSKQRRKPDPQLNLFD